MKMIIFCVCILLVSCNPPDKQRNINLNTPTQEKMTNKSYKVEKFMSFNNKTRYKDVIKYLITQNLSYIENVDLLSFKYYKTNEFPTSTFSIFLPCEYAKFLWVPVLNVEDMVFKNNLICFNEDRLCLIILFKHTIDMGANVEFDELRKYYKKKYGDEGNCSLVIDSLKSENTVFHRKICDYYNYKDSINVYLYNSVRDVFTETDVTTYITDEISISFSSCRDLFSKCRSYSDTLQKKGMEKQKEKDQKVIDNL